jgi:hypothetical protein
MIKMILKKIIFSIFYFFFITVLIANDYKDIIKETYSNRKLDTIEGLWQKSYANQGSTGCITMFYKVKQNSFNQIHIDSCFVVDKITGKHKKIDENNYEGENAIYYYDRNSTWSPSSIKISKKLDSIYITHKGHGNTFTEQWIRIWPKNLIEYNNNVK